MLKLIEPASSPLISLLKLKNYLRVDHNEDDTQLKLLIEAATSLVEQEIGQTLLSKIWRRQGPTIVGENGLSRITLPNPPIVRIISVEERRDDGSTRPIRRFALEGDAPVPTLAVPGVVSKLDVVYQAGFGDKPSSVPATLRQAVLMLAADMYEHRTAERCLASNSLVRIMLEPFKTRTLN